jgi:hypothetical protein
MRIRNVFENLGSSKSLCSAVRTKQMRIKQDALLSSAAGNNIVGFLSFALELFCFDP